MSTSTSQSHGSRLNALPWLAFACGGLASIYAAWMTVTESGDPPYTANDAWQRAAIIACPLLFATAAVSAFLLRQRVAALVILVLGIVICFLGWNVVHWDVPTLFR
jgi:hypothetical protein